MVCLVVVGVCPSGGVCLCGRPRTGEVGTEARMGGIDVGEVRRGKDCNGDG